MITENKSLEFLRLFPKKKRYASNYGATTVSIFNIGLHNDTLLQQTVSAGPSIMTAYRVRFSSNTRFMAVAAAAAEKRIKPTRTAANGLRQKCVLCGHGGETVKRRKGVLTASDFPSLPLTAPALYKRRPAMLYRCH